MKGKDTKVEQGKVHEVCMEPFELEDQLRESLTLKSEESVAGIWDWRLIKEWILCGSNPGGVGEGALCSSHT